MKYLIISDVHGNWEALQAVLRKTKRKAFDWLLMLGDLVGYGAAPNQVVRAFREVGRPMVIIRGNHDKVAAGIDEGLAFNPVALAAALWTRTKLEAVNLNYLRALEQGPTPVGEFIICHGSPVDEDEYVFSAEDALGVFERASFDLCFFGHTHLPCVFGVSQDGLDGALLRGARGSLQLEDGVRYLINPGSVGQPRDRDPRASYMTYDSELRLVTWRRLRYPVAKAQRRIRRAGLPPALADRLARGT